MANASTKNQATGKTVRFHVAWMIPFPEFTRVGLVDGVTWWLDSISLDEIKAKKRYNALSDVIKANNGALILYEIIADTKSSAYRSRPMLRLGQQATPPEIQDIEPAPVEITELLAGLQESFNARQAEIRRRQEKSDPVLRRIPSRIPTLRKPKRSGRAGWMTMAGCVAAIGALTAYGMEARFRIDPVAVQSSASEKAAEAQAWEKAYQGKIVMRSRDDSTKCETYAINSKTLKQTYTGTADCHRRN